MTGGPFSIRQHKLHALLIGEIDHKRPLEVGRQRVVVLVDDHEQLGTGDAGYVHHVELFLTNYRLVVVRPETWIGDHECEFGSIRGLQPVEDALLIRLEQHETSVTGESQQTLWEGEDSFLSYLDCSESSRLNLHVDLRP